MLSDEADTKRKTATNAATLVATSVAVTAYLEASCWILAAYKSEAPLPAVKSIR